MALRFPSGLWLFVGLGLYALLYLLLTAAARAPLEGGDGLERLTLIGPPKLVRNPYRRSNGATLKLPESISGEFDGVISTEEVDARSEEIAGSVLKQLNTERIGRVFLALTDLTHPEKGDGATTKKPESVNAQVNSDLAIQRLKEQGIVSSVTTLTNIGLVIVDFQSDVDSSVIRESIKNFWHTNPDIWMIEADAPLTFRDSPTFLPSPMDTTAADGKSFFNSTNPTLPQDGWPIELFNEDESDNWGTEESAQLRQNELVLPNDKFFSQQWALHNPNNTSVDIKAVKAWQLAHSSKGWKDGHDVVVAHIDTGVDTSHPDLQGQLWRNPGEIPDNGIDDDRNGYIDDVMGWNFVDNNNDINDKHGHGTHTAGILAAVANNGVGIAGMAQKVKLMVLKFKSSATDAAMAIEYSLRNGAEISSNSWGYSTPIESLRIALERTKRAGQLFVCAVDNAGSDNMKQNDFPPNWALSNMISVASITSEGYLSRTSNYGAKNVDIAAPGVRILSTVPASIFRRWYGFKDGTSMATPLVAGLGAMLKTMMPSLTASNIKRIILETSSPLPGLRNRVVTGGIINAEAAVRHVLEICKSCKSAIVSPPMPLPRPATGRPVGGSTGYAYSLWQQFTEAAGSLFGYPTTSRSPLEGVSLPFLKEQPLLDI